MRNRYYKAYEARMRAEAEAAAKALEETPPMEAEPIMTPVSAPSPLGGSNMMMWAGIGIGALILLSLLFRR